MSNSIFDALCANWCMMKPLSRGGGCRCCHGLDDSVLEDVEREQSERRQLAGAGQPEKQEPMNVSTERDGQPLESLDPVGVRMLDQPANDAPMSAGTDKRY
ncbi:hypothetical protein M0805_003500 [Coniferiporia weirii]|nr:hypothetical protein M0805_003500 [Coniferiporia weirii]